MRRTLTLSGLAGLAVLLAGVLIGGIHSAVSASGNPSAPTAKLAFTESGQAELPRGYRSWVHAYVAWEPITTSLLDEEITSTPEFHNVYVEPYAYRVYMETGKWPEGSLIVKEFSFTSVDGKNCNGPPAYLCNAWFGKVIFQHGFTGIALMLKDSKRYPEDAGGWAYFTFGHQEPPYEKVATKHSQERCAQCHIDRAGAEQDYVFSVNHPGLSREGDDARHNLEAAFPN
ncbi:cytochrome P460 family protein [Rhizobium laguerreae]|uniref:cytochrome P460 family protein n=1 Tax=Rhizobium laguerreae TaxID=1076926 RepID=UPI001C91F8B0|nr:cytochrome P460 family protein [Rhizobium laguerreae]MBY3088901.1 cytochrome P460 family protein [Rhizobium laguerreae]MBY3150609.1 cytochrome P460 family protein [Rhizobium laguerreae]